MARMPGTVWLGEQSPETPMTRYDIVCIHTIVGYAPAHAAHFSVKADGTILQSRDTRFRSAANLDGNHRIIAIENEDHGLAFGGTPKLPEWVPLTDAQVEANAAIAAWCHDEHGIPLQLCPDSKPGSRGLAYHRQGIDGNFGPGTAYPNPGRVPGGEVWTSSPGKVCPTDVRINQRPLILSRAIEITTPEDPMADYADQLDRIEKAVNQTNRGLAKFRENVHRRDVDLARTVKSVLDGVTADQKLDTSQVAQLKRIQATLEAGFADEADA